jgi:hypothetical protein
MKLFRKIRQRLLAQNRGTRYLLYAVGEIVLVVIGILIALQINNWNQQRQRNNQETIYLEDLKRDFLFDIETLHQKIAQNENAIESVTQVMTLISSKTELSDPEIIQFYQLITPLCGESYFIPEQGTIHQIEAGSAGNYIQNKALKDQIFRYYSSREREEKNMEQSVQLYQHNFITPNILSIGFDPLVSEMALNGNYELDPIDFSSLLKNKQFISALVMKNSSCANQNRMYKRTQEEAQQMISLINDELKK